MNKFAQKVTSLAYIYLILSAQHIDAARVRQRDKAAHASRQSQEVMKAMQQMEEAVQEIDEIESEGQASYEWVGRWATKCSDREKDFLTGQKALNAQYDKAMEDGQMSTMESGRVALKAYSISKTLSKATKSGCEWVNDKSMDSPAMKEMLVKTLKSNKCVPVAVAFLEKAFAANESPDEARAKAEKIMFSMDCELPSEESGADSEAAAAEANPFDIEEEAEAGALSEVQEFKKSLKAGNQTSLVETKSSQQIVIVLMVFMGFFLAAALSSLACVLKSGILALHLTLMFLPIKLLFKLALGSSSIQDLRTEFQQIMKPFFHVIFTGCLVVQTFVWAAVTPFFPPAGAGGVVGSVYWGPWVRRVIAGNETVAK